MDDKKLSSYFKEFDELDESFVRVMVSSEAWASKFDKSKHGAAEEWVRRKDEERALASSSKRDAREEETLSIAKEANCIAREQARWTRYAMITAAIAVTIAVIAARADIKWLISWLITIFKTP